MKRRKLSRREAAQILIEAHRYQRRTERTIGGLLPIHLAPDVWEQVVDALVPLTDGPGNGAGGGEPIIPSR